jgi:hypothetical protein
MGFSSGGGGDRATALGVSGAVAQERGPWGEREEPKEVPKLYTGREREKGKWKGAVAGSLP